MAEKKIYQVIWTPKADKQLSQLEDKNEAKELYKNANRSLAYYPYKHKKLYGKWVGFRRYSFGKYRVIYKIIEQKPVIVLVVKTGLREDVYEKKTK